MGEEKVFTEGIHPLGVDLGEITLAEVLTRMQTEHQQGIAAVRNAIPQIEPVVRAYATTYREGGRIFYVGAGTSGRLGFVDAAELPSTFGIAPDLVQVIFPGNIVDASSEVDSREDDAAAGCRAVARCDVGSNDLVIGVTASGETPFVLGAIEEARVRGARTAGIINNVETALEELVDMPIVVVTGPELIAGSTRLKAGTVQKVVLNMLSTAAMVSLGKVYRGFMIGLRANNEKLKKRAIRSLIALTGRETALVEKALLSADCEVDTAFLMLARDLLPDAARRLLQDSKGNARMAMKGLEGGDDVSPNT